MRHAAIAITLALCALGCGASPERIARSADPDPECPEGTPVLTAREVIGPVPRRFEVLPPERPKPVERFMAGLRGEMGPAYRSHDTQVIYRRGALEGTVVVVLNLHKGRPEGFVEGMKQGERDEGVQGEPLDIDGQEGRLAPSGDSYVASAPSGPCSVVILIAMEKQKLQEAAGLIGARD